MPRLLSELYLCVDGGGTKTTAVICDGGGKILGTGQAGPSNLTSGVDHTVSAVNTATKTAIACIDTSLTWPHPEIGFANAWIGIAGCARPPDYALLEPPLEALFPKDSPWRLTNDAELLTSPIFGTEYTEVVTVICGTGSLGLRWKRERSADIGEADRVVQVARSGGWGALLGDEGSGWSMGREGVKSVLTHGANNLPLRPFHHAIMQRLGASHPDDIIPSLALPRIEDLDGKSTGQVESERKGRIAGCTKHVIEAANEGDEEAIRIVERVAKEVVEVLRPLVTDEGGKRDLRGTMLVMGGGLSGVDLFRGVVERCMREEGWEWGIVHVVVDPAVDGAKAMAAASRVRR